MHHFIFKTDCVENALQELKFFGFKDLYTIEEFSSTLIGAFREAKELPPLKYCHLHEIQPAQINWESQWESFAPHYKNGLSKISLTNICRTRKSFMLAPGPGFGDLSHPSTKLMLKVMKDEVRDKTVYDIGCGSGILSIAAILLGAKMAYANDIDALALKHAQKNIDLNSLDYQIKILNRLPSNFPSTSIFLINITMHEQLKIIQKLPQEFPIISSGILSKQKPFFLDALLPRKAFKIKTLSNWLAFLIKV